jgi:hypothetical protein
MAGPLLSSSEGSQVIVGESVVGGAVQPCDDKIVKRRQITDIFVDFQGICPGLRHVPPSGPDARAGHIPLAERTSLSTRLDMIDESGRKAPSARAGRANATKMLNVNTSRT